MFLGFFFTCVGETSTMKGCPMTSECKLVGLEVHSWVESSIPWKEPFQIPRLYPSSMKRNFKDEQITPTSVLR